MSRSRILFGLSPLLVLLLLASGCGGGGGGGTPTPVDPDDGTDMDMVDPQVVADSETILETCVLPGLADAQDLAALVHRVILGTAAGDGVALAPDGVQVDDSGETAVLRVRWQQDVEMDGAPEIEGEILFFDAMAEEIQPFTEPELMALEMDISALGSLLSSLPAGAYLRVLANSPASGVLGTVVVAVDAGVPGASTGAVSLTGDPDCTLDVSWTGVDIGTFDGAYPSGLFSFDATAPEGVLAGEITTDGTDQASATTTLDGGDALDWALDLLGGQATAL